MLLNISCACKASAVLRPFYDNEPRWTTKDTKWWDVSCIFVTFEEQAMATWDMFVHASRDLWHTTKLVSLSVSLALSHTHALICYAPPPPSGSVCVGVRVCTCVYDKPHWWKNSRLAGFPDWVALDMHTTKALQVDVLALQRCNSLAWLTQNTLETQKHNPDFFFPALPLNYWGKKEKKMYLLFIALWALCMCLSISACMRGYVFIVGKKCV